MVKCEYVLIGSSLFILLNIGLSFWIIQQTKKSNLCSYAIRLLPGQDLREELIKFTKEKGLQAGFIQTCVGSLENAKLRLANENNITHFDGPHEIVSLVGTLSPSGVHIHLAVSDKKGNVVGGHLTSGSIVRTTAEIVIGHLRGVTFSTAIDEKTGCRELSIKQ